MNIMSNMVRSLMTNKINYNSVNIMCIKYTKTIINSDKNYQNIVTMKVSVV